MPNDIYTTAQLSNSLNCLESCVSQRNNGALEDVLRHNLSSFLRLMFPGSPTWVNLHIQGSEAQVSFSRNAAEHYGFVDSLVGATAIEYEGDLRKRVKFKTGYNQVKEYCAGLLNQGYPPENIRGILSDTVIWKAYDIELNSFEENTSYSASNISLIEIQSLDCETDTNANYLLLDFLNKHLGRIGSRLLNAESINNDLGFDSSLSLEFLPRLTSAIDEISSRNEEYAELIESVWCKFVNSVQETEQQDNFDIAFYVDEFYLTTIAKCLCANVLSETPLISNEEEILSILNGAFFTLRGYNNIVEYDFFGWLNNSPVHQHIIDLVTQIQLDLRAYDYSLEIQEDLFSNLFSQLASKSRRLLLGQEMTPAWLAKSIVRKVVEELDEEPRLIDMCCGSGTFIVETIRFIIDTESDSNNEEKLTKILNAITGFDIDPLAIILAKVNWVIVAKPFISQSTVTDVNIPIYNADSLFAVTPVSTENDSEDAFSIRLLNKIVELPKILINRENKDLFEKILNIGYSLINELDELPKESHFYKNIVSNITQEINLSIENAQIQVIDKFVMDFYLAIFELHSEGKNGIWNFLIQNSYRPGLVENSFNGIVSNPPWLTLSRIAENPYKGFLYDISDSLNIRPTGSSFLHTELATIFLLSSVDRYLTENSKIGCVLPGTIMSGDHHHAFRSGDYREVNVPFKIQEIWNLDKTVFNNRGSVVFGKKVIEPNANPILGINDLSSETSIETQFFYATLDDKSAWTTYNITRTSENSYVENFTQGADIMPRSLYFHELSQNGDNYNALPINRETSQLSFLLKDLKKFSDFRIEASTIERDVIYPVMLSNGLMPFYISPLPMAILPIEKQEGRWVSIERSKLISMSTGFKRLISRATLQYGTEANIDTLWSWLNTRNKLNNQSISDGGFIIFSGTGGQYVCAHYLSSTECDFDRLVIDQTVNYFQVQDENEAKFIVGLLNNNIVSDAIRSFQSEGNFGARHIHSLPYRIIPKYDSENTNHQRVVESSNALIEELNQFFIQSDDPAIIRLRNPNESSIAFKRKKIRQLITTMPSYERYNIACNIIINE